MASWLKMSEFSGSEYEDESENESKPPPELQEIAKITDLESMPGKSRRLYEATYTKFTKWKKTNNEGTSEDSLLRYFNELQSSYKPSTLWAQFSMLKHVILLRENIDLKNFSALLSFLKEYSKGFKSKKSQVFTTEQIKTFLETAPNELYLTTKVNFSV